MLHVPSECLVVQIPTRGLVDLAPGREEGAHCLHVVLLVFRRKVGPRLVGFLCYSSQPGREEEAHRLHVVRLMFGTKEGPGLAGFLCYSSRLGREQGTHWLPYRRNEGTRI